MEVMIYTDGSFSKASPMVTTGGMVLLKAEEFICGQRYQTTQNNYVCMRNVGGELFAVQCAILVAASYIQRSLLQLKEEGSSTITIYHDYIGISDFATGKWVAKKFGAQIYVNAIKQFYATYPNIKLQFVKVKAHSGNKWNDIVDNIANGVINEEITNKMLPEYCLKERM